MRPASSGRASSVGYCCSRCGGLLSAHEEMRMPWVMHHGESERVWAATLSLGNARGPRGVFESAQ